MLGHEENPWKKLLLVADFLDKLEHDFKEVYPDMESPMPEGYKGTLERLLGEKYGGNEEKHDLKD